MGKYRLKSKQKGSVITLMEVDTECQAWYIQADDRNAALQVLKAMSDEIRCLRNIYLNGDDVTEDDRLLAHAEGLRSRDILLLAL